MTDIGYLFPNICLISFNNSIIVYYFDEVMFLLFWAGWQTLVKNIIGKHIIAFTGCINLICEIYDATLRM